MAASFGPGNPPSSPSSPPPPPPFGGEASSSPVSAPAPAPAHCLQFTDGRSQEVVAERVLSRRHHIALQSIMEGRDSGHAYEHTQVGFESAERQPPHAGGRGETGDQDFAAMNLRYPGRGSTSAADAAAGSSNHNSPTAASSTSSASKAATGAHGSRGGNGGNGSPTMAAEEHKEEAGVPAAQAARGVPRTAQGGLLEENQNSKPAAVSGPSLSSSSSSRRKQSAPRRLAPSLQAPGNNLEGTSAAPAQAAAAPVTGRRRRGSSAEPRDPASRTQQHHHHQQQQQQQQQQHSALPAQQQQQQASHQAPRPPHQPSQQYPEGGSSVARPAKRLRLDQTDSWPRLSTASVQPPSQQQQQQQQPPLPPTASSSAPRMRRAASAQPHPRGSGPGGPGSQAVHPQGQGGPRPPAGVPRPVPGLVRPLHPASSASASAVSASAVSAFSPSASPGAAMDLDDEGVSPFRGGEAGGTGRLLSEDFVPSSRQQQQQPPHRHPFDSSSAAVASSEAAPGEEDEEGDTRMVFAVEESDEAAAVAGDDGPARNQAQPYRPPNPHQHHDHSQQPHPQQHRQQQQQQQHQQQPPLQQQHRRALSNNNHQPPGARRQLSAASHPFVSGNQNPSSAASSSSAMQVSPAPLSPPRGSSSSSSSGGGGSGAAPSSSGRSQGFQRQQIQLSEMFGLRTPAPSSSSSTSGPGGGGGDQPSVSSSSSGAAVAAANVRLQRSEAEAAAAREALSRAEAELQEERRHHQQTVRAGEEYRRTAREHLIRILREAADLERREKERELSQTLVDYGRAVPQVNGGTIWEDGELIRQAKAQLEDLRRRQQELAQLRAGHTQQRRAHQKQLQLQAQQQSMATDDDADEFRRPLLPGMHGTPASSSSSSSAGTSLFSATPGGSGNMTSASAASSSSSMLMVGGVPQPDVFDPVELQEHTYRLTQLLLKRELAEWEAKLSELERSRQRLARQQKILDDQRASDYSQPHYEILNDRYVRLNMLGKGGFSEVWKAFDLDELRYVACKIHRLRPEWPEQWKRNYTKHAEREYKIHRSLRHPNVLPLFDVFAMDLNSFCTVLELCDGCDLDMYLKVHHTLPEREARTIIAQVLAGLRHLHEQKTRIIHYDLKPGNILFDRGLVKLADFGLSKEMHNQQDDSIELTSQGAGTPWYLPPECFAVGGASISPRVDIWSAGVVLYQMLYGRKPFGDGMSADAVMQRGTIAQARVVEFPDKPVVSEAAKDLVRRCLTYDAHQRPDAAALLNHAFFGPIFAAGPSSVGGSGSTASASAGAASSSRSRRRQHNFPNSDAFD